MSGSLGLRTVGQETFERKTSWRRNTGKIRNPLTGCERTVVFHRHVSEGRAGGGPEWRGDGVQ